ncbi:MAG: primosomal protein N' [Gammaproteobacteria bacterium]|nr:primosomal protein N' [Gammaproteobacteria bacterium]
MAPPNHRLATSILQNRVPSFTKQPAKATPADKPLILRVAVNAPLNRYFDYLCPDDWQSKPLQPGMRLQVPFGRSKTVGVLLETATSSELPLSRLKRALAVIDDEPVFDDALMKLLSWSADYFHHAPGEVFATALPALLRGTRPLPSAPEYWRTTALGQTENPPKRAPRQQALLDLLRERGPASTAELPALFKGWRPSMKALCEKQLVERCLIEAEPERPDQKQPADISLNGPQQKAVTDIGETFGRFATSLLFGVTGSGKTEVYLALIRRLLASGKQAMVLVPEIGLTPQLIQRFRDRLPGKLAVLHSALSDGQRLEAWRCARSGEASIILGTRSAVFAPMLRPGLIIVDEEHDVSFKQQDGFRYSARDLAIVRARLHGIPVVLGSATPALESMHNAESGRYRLCELPERPGGAVPPSMRIVDLGAHRSDHGLATPSIMAMHTHLDQGGQVLLFLNRRGFAPALFCAECGWVAGCRRCDARMTVHAAQGQLRCHHCDQRSAIPAHCAQCREELIPVGQGTQRVEDFLRQQFPAVGVTRIDRDSTRRKGSLPDKLDEVRSGRSRILVGTQMLAKGHDFPDISLVIVMDADQGLFGTDFRSSERLAQTITQVAGRAGRAQRPGEVLIQTRFADHPLLLDLIKDGYSGFATDALAERRAAGWPPYSHLALLRAESPNPDDARIFLEAARTEAEKLSSGDPCLLGPAPAPMEKRAGRFRAQLLLQSNRRSSLHKLLKDWVIKLENLPQRRKVRWSLDVDPADMF